jgi:Fuc2NAc and GlcNAc transferase
MLHNIPQSLLSAILIAFWASFFFCFPVYTFLRRLGVTDLPNSRSSHDRSVVRGGGISIVCGFLLGSLFLNDLSNGKCASLASGIILFAALSFWDDVKSLPVVIRFSGHTIAAIVALAVLGLPHAAVELAGIHAISFTGICIVTLMFCWLVGYTNAFNFMDGINGIAAMQALITGIGMGLIAGTATGSWSILPIQLCFTVAASAAGFLPHNFPRARMFMGDTGSVSLGFLLAVLTLWIARDAGWWLLIPLCLLHANFILDTSITFIRRLSGGQRWYEAHREHFYQRLIRTGSSHVSVALTEGILQCVTLAMLVLYVRVKVATQWALGIAVVGMWLCFLFAAEYHFRKSIRSHDSLRKGNR